MSDAGSIFDKLLTHATTADPNYSTTRGVKLSLNDEEFPHAFAWNARISIGRLAFLQDEVSGQYTVSLATKGETQEQLLVRYDAYKARIQADRTLTGEVDDAFVSDMVLREDPRSSEKVVDITISTEKLE
jgi:hypothetical protein